MCWGLAAKRSNKLVKFFRSKVIQLSYFEVTPYDAQAITYHMATVPPEGLLSIDFLEDFQRKQMDGNYDWLFSDTPCLVGNHLKNINTDSKTPQPI